MKKVKYCIGAFFGIPEYVEHIVPDDDNGDIPNQNNLEAVVQAGHTSVTSNQRKSCGQSQKSARQKRKERKGARK